MNKLWNLKVFEPWISVTLNLSFKNYNFKTIKNYLLDQWNFINQEVKHGLILGYKNECALIGAF